MHSCRTSPGVVCYCSRAWSCTSFSSRLVSLCLACSSLTHSFVDAVRLLACVPQPQEAICIPNRQVLYRSVLRLDSQVVPSSFFLFSDAIAFSVATKRAKERPYHLLDLHLCWAFQGTPCRCYYFVAPVPPLTASHIAHGTHNRGRRRYATCINR